MRPIGQRPCGRSARRRAFTLVELLVVITIIGILMSLLLPAVQSAREAARRVQCANNIRNLGVALNSYHTAFKIFPPSSVWRVDNKLNVANIESTSGNRLYENWVILILPQLENQNLRNTFDLTQSTQSNTAGPDGTNNATARGTSLAVMLCPSDPYSLKPFDGAGSSATTSLGSNWARGNYGANAALGKMSIKAHAADGPFDAASLTGGWNNRFVQGVMGANVSLRIDDIKDGASNTVLLGELRAGIMPFDNRGVWAMSGGSSALWAHGYYGDDNGPNSPGTGLADDVLSCDDIWKAAGGQTQVTQLGMSCAGGGGVKPNWQQTTRSLHPGGVNVCFADASVHFISDFVDKGTPANPPSTANLGLWDKLNLSNDRQPIDASGY